MLEIPLINLALFLVAAITAGLAVYAFANIKVRGALEFCLLMVSLTFYIGGFGFELLAPGKAEILFWLKIEYFSMLEINLVIYWVNLYKGFVFKFLLSGVEGYLMISNFKFKKFVLSPATKTIWEKWGYKTPNP